jgi:hypothetical protein
MKWKHLLVLGSLCAALICAGSGLLLAHLRYWRSHNRPAPFGLHADILVSPGSIGIPGITKMYSAELTNYGVFPVRVTRCEFIDDTATPGAMVLYRAERQLRPQDGWETIADFAKHCKPYPTGFGSTRLVERLVWPGESLGTGSEATAARDSVNKGDFIRFVLYLDAARPGANTIATDSIGIDESPEDRGIGYRVRH